ncbi:MAG: cupin domain-containing protein [Terriglobales bacterium]
MKYPGVSLVLMLKKSGTQIGKHRAAGWIAVKMVQGKIRMHLPEGQSVDLSLGDLLRLDRGFEHDVEACEESAILLNHGMNSSPAEKAGSEGPLNVQRRFHEPAAHLRLRLFIANGARRCMPCCIWE